MRTELPPGPRLPGLLQTVLFLKWPYSFVSRCQRRYGDVFTLNLTAPKEGAPASIVYLADPAAIKELFSMDGQEGHAGEANALLEPITGPRSILMLDRDRHLSERRLIGPAFHGDALLSLDSIIRQATRRELSTWPGKGIFPVRPAMQRITFEVIMRAVLGVHDRALQSRLQDALEPVFNISVGQIAGLSPAFRIDLGRWSPWGRFRQTVVQLDEVLLDLIAQRRCTEQRNDILGLLLATVDDHGNRLTDSHIRDELVTFLLAGHETTATALAWAFERLAHHPAVVSGLQAELDQGNEETIDAIVAETLRVRPVVMDVARRLSAEVELGGFRLPARTTLMPAIYLVHFDPKNYEDPDAFRPDRFLSEPPNRSTWLPFGGGRRRCIGASFAQMEMRIVLSMALREYEPEPASSRAERPCLRGVTFAPEHGALVRMRPLSPSRSTSTSTATQ